MGLIICHRHGESGIMPFVARELSEEIRRGGKVSVSDLVEVEIVLIDEEDGEQMYTLHYLMPRALFVRLGVQASYEIRTDEDEERLTAIFDPVMKGGGVCGKCFRDCLIDADGN